MSSVEQQIASLRPFVRSGLALNLNYCLAAAAVLLTALSVVLWHPVPLMFATFVAVVALGSRESGPLVTAAIAAYDSATPSFGQVTISISDHRDADTYQALISEPDQPIWKFEFIPQSWHPVAGSYPARVWRLQHEYPVLAATEDGVLIPRYKPNRWQARQ